MRTFSLCLLALCILFAVAGCKHGRDFAKPSPDTLILGQTTRADIEGTYGNPLRQSSAIRTDDGERAGYLPATPFAPALVAGSFSSITYLHTDDTARILYGGRANAKAINFVFWNDTLVGYDFVSTFEGDASNFEESRIDNLRKAQTTKADVIQLFGEPTGRLVYPLIRDQGCEEFIYKYVELGVRARKSKSLLILFAAEGTVQDLRFGSDDAPIPTQPSSNYVPMPVVIPHK